MLMDMRGKAVLISGGTSGIGLTAARMLLGAGAKVALLGKDARLPILKEEGDWYLVSLRGAVGWIQK